MNGVFDPRQLLEALTARGVDFVVVGGIAARILGATRNTDDLDVAYATDEQNLRALGEVLVGLNARLLDVKEDVPFVPDERTLKNVQLLTLETEHGRLDVMTRPDGSPPYRQLKSRARREDLGSFSVLVASINDLIDMKEASDRDKDRLDAKELRKVRSLERRGRKPV